MLYRKMCHITSEVVRLSKHTETFVVIQSAFKQQSVIWVFQKNSSNISVVFGISANPLAELPHIPLHWLPAIAINVKCILLRHTVGLLFGCLGISSPQTLP